MINEQPTSAPPPAPAPDWNPAPPERIPPPTVWPAFLSLASTLVVWGFIASYLLSLAGAGLAIISLAGWIHELRHEHAA